MSDTSGTRRLAVYAIPESKDGEKRYWPKIGIAFANRDGSITLILEALPCGTNTLQVREQKPPAERGGAAERGAANGAASTRRQGGFETVEVGP
jgi:hypothetical protein